MGTESGPMEPRAWAQLRMTVSDPLKSTSLFRTLPPTISGEATGIWQFAMSMTLRSEETPGR